jgi:hypothetical protein
MKFPNFLLVLLLMSGVPAISLAGAKAHQLRSSILAGTTGFAAHIDAGATGFENPKISPDGRLVGWLADFPPGCCESYSVSLELVVMDVSRRLHVFSPPRAIVGWCFSKDSRAVVYSMAELHGPTDEQFELRSVEDGKLLKRFDLPWSALERQLDGKPSKAIIPVWAACAATYPGQKIVSG